MSLALVVFSQIFFTGSNDLRYWRWKEPDNERFQDIMDLEALWGNWGVGGKFLYIQPDQYYTQPSTEDLVQKYAYYESPEFRARVGSYYASFGRGLVLAGVRDDELLLDRWLEGGDVAASWGPFEGEFLSGTKREIFYYAYSTYEKNTLRGARVSLVKIPHLDVSGAYVRVNQPQYDSTYKTEFKSGGIGVNFPWTEFYAEVVKREGFCERMYLLGDSTPDTTTYNYYTSLSVGTQGINLLLESKEYKLLGNGFNNPPVINHYGIYLAGLEDQLDEAGHGITLSAAPVPGLRAQLHRSLSTRSSTSQRVEENFGLVSYRRTGAFRITARADYALLDSVLEEQYEDTLVPVIVNKRTEITPEGELVVYFLGQASATLGYTHRMRTDIYPYYQDTLQLIDTLDYTDRKIKIGLGWGPLGSVWWSYSDRKKGDGSCLGTWRSWELSLHINEHLDLMAYYGAHRGEVLCSGGICRYEPAFDGVKLWLLSRF